MLTLAKYPTSHAQNRCCPLTYYWRKVVAYFSLLQKEPTLFFLLVCKINKGGTFPRNKVVKLQMTLPWVIPRKYELWWNVWRCRLFCSGNRHTAALEPPTKQVGGCDCEGINQTHCSFLQQQYLPLTRLTRFLDNRSRPLECRCNCYLPAACELLVSAGDTAGNYVRPRTRARDNCLKKFSEWNTFTRLAFIWKEFWYCFL